MHLFQDLDVLDQGDRKFHNTPIPQYPKFHFIYAKDNLLKAT